MLSPDDQGRFSLNVRVVTPAFFRALGVPIVAGRDFAAGDRRGAPPVAILNESAARLYLAGTGAAGVVGHRVVVGTRLGLGGERVGGEVVGVVGDVRDVGPGTAARPTTLCRARAVPDGLSHDRGARAGGGRRSASCASICGGGVDPTVPVFRERTMDQFASRATSAQPRIYLTLLAVFAVTAVALAAIGIYGVMAQNVVARSREIGVGSPSARPGRMWCRMIIRVGGPSDRDRRRRWLQRSRSWLVPPSRG